MCLKSHLGVVLCQTINLGLSDVTRAQCVPAECYMLTVYTQNQFLGK